MENETTDRAVSFGLNVTLHSGYSWTQYMRDLWDIMLAAAPEPKE